MTDEVRHEAADRLVYVQAMLLDLKAICDSERCTFLAHLLEMAYIEASDGLRHVGTQSSGRIKN
ncbi:hypothetical protein [Mesorhizobium sp. IMUNJ 23232]|uniref:hypothetical protein n=1 Tax=Mesorhizobium sp. IMUNJ 23232 TaxID=3376064 RepID=UPI0037BB7A69